MAARLLGQIRKLHSEVLPSFIHKTPLKVKSESLPASLYGGRHLVTMLPGSGIGPEMCNCIQDIFSAAQVPVDFEIIEGSGEDLVRNAIISIKRNGVGIKGNLRNVIDQDGFIAPNVNLRNELDLYAYVLHYKSYKNVYCKYPDLDLMIIRQNTEGEYALLEHESVKGVVESMKIITKENTHRLAKFAYEHARKNGRRKITVVHKSKQLVVSDGMFLNTIKEVAENYPDLEFEEMYIDRCCEKLVKKPYHFDVLLMPNLYGNIASNIVCGLAGGAGLFSGVNYGENFTVFESATRQTGDALVGRNVANPIAMLNASVNLLQHLSKNQHAQHIADAINHTLCTSRIHTADLGGTSSTSDIIKSIKNYIEENLHNYKNQM